MSFILRAFASLRLASAERAREDDPLFETRADEVRFGVLLDAACPEEVLRVLPFFFAVIFDLELAFAANVLSL